MNTTTETDWVADIGQSAYSSIREMVAALQCDYDRLEELREERDDWVANDGGDDDEQDRTPEDWAKEFAEEAAELTDLEEAAGDCDSREDAEQRIQEDPLSLRIFGERTDGEWEATNFELLLTTGGPAVRIVGDINAGCADRCRLEVQDWFKPWTEYRPADEDVLETYCNTFCIGE